VGDETGDPEASDVIGLKITEEKVGDLIKQALNLQRRIGDH